MENKLDGYSMDLELDNKDKLKAIFPECFAEDKLDIDKLLSLCGEYIDEDFEKYKFEWKGKANCLKLAQQRSRGTLRPKIEDSVNFDTTENLYIEGDNLEVLKLLQTSYYRKVKMIYIDPPYNTGNDFVYEDDFKDSIKKYKEVTSQATKSNPENMGRFHTNWLNMIYPRLRLASNLLTDDGVIFISIDYNESYNLRKICNEVFGEEHFVGEITWESKTKSQNTKTSYNKLQPKTETIYVYSKISKKRFNLVIKEKKNYNFEDEQGVYREHILEVMNSEGVRGRESMIFDISDGIHTVSLPNEKQWQIGKDTVDEYLKTNNLFIRDNKVVIKMRPEFERDETTEPFWGFLGKDLGTAESGKKELQNIIGKNGFETVKPLEIIKKLIYHVTDNNDIILDFFSGSATTAHAVMQLNAEDGGNRKFICVQLPEVTPEDSEAFKNGYKNICEIGKERIRRAGAKILEETPKSTLDERKTPLDIGFKVLALDTSNLYNWDNSSSEKFTTNEYFERLNSMILSIKEDRTDMDMIFEIMLKMGVTLDTPITHVEINDKIAYVVGDYLLLICLAPLMTVEDVEVMIELAPGKVVIAEKCFINDSIISNAYYLLENAEIEFKLI